MSALPSTEELLARAQAGQNAPHNVVPAYIAHDWKLCTIPPLSKAPRTEGWNLVENALASAAILPEGWGVGLLHSYSKSCAIDLDDLFMAQVMFAERGIDLQALMDAPDAVQVVSGRPGSGKLLYALPDPLPSRSIKLGPKTIVEFRCATADGLSVQDVLSPSKHPSGTTYAWAGSGSWQALPPLPESIRAWWEELQIEKHVPASGSSTLENLDEVRSALKAIPASVCHDTWLEVIMALHSTGHADAYELAREWSMTCPEKYPGDRTFTTRWGSFKDKVNKITIASLFHHAREHGWVAPPVDVTKLFNKDSTLPDILAEMFLPPPKIDPNLFPAALRDYALDVAKSVGCDPSVPLMAGLAAISAAFDGRSRLALREDFIVPPNIWVMTIGGSGDKKSPGSKPMFKPLGLIEMDDVARYKMDMLRWEAEEAAYAAAKKSMLQQASGGEHAMATGNGDILVGLPGIPEMRAQPVPKKIVTTNSTSQKFVAMCAERPEGMLLNLDEGNGFLTRLAAQTGTDDRSTWVVSYESERYFNDRIGSGSVICENFSSTIFCNVQPKVARKVGPALLTDGCSQRFIPVVLDARCTSPGARDVHPDSAAWAHLLRNVHALSHRTYTLSPEASDLFEQWNIEVDGLKEGFILSDYSDYAVSAHGKFSGLTGRTALLFHVATDAPGDQVSADTMRRAITFVRRYVSNSVLYTDENFLGQKNLSRWVAEKILDAAPEQTITMRQMKRSAERQIEDMPDHIAEVRLRHCMDELEARKWVAVAEENRKTITWAINPALVEVFEAQRKEIIRKRLELKEKLTAAFQARWEG